MRNILLFIDNVSESEDLAKMALKIANQCEANLHLCNVSTSQVNKKVLIHHDHEDVLTDRHINADIPGLAKQLKIDEQPEQVFIPSIRCFELGSFNPRAIAEMVVRNNVWMIVIDERQLNHLKNIDSGNFALRVIENINCPVLIIPEDFELSYFNKIAYVTDLRYCDFGVVNFLKVFNAQLFVNHISAPGLPDMDDRYAQEILTDVVSVKANYLKMFLRNLKSKNIKASIDSVLDTLEIKMTALVGKKHQTFERLFDRFPEKIQIYHSLPTLIFPYLNWFNQASFYTS
jgi:nucleotide-binding universal stress UspA family protein